MTEQTHNLGPRDEPQNSGAIVAVHHGNYREQELWIRSGSSIGNWWCLGGEHGRPRIWIDSRTELEKRLRHPRDPQPQPGPGDIPLHPRWEDVLKRGPVTLLSAADQDTYQAGWAAGRHHLVEQIEGLE